MAVAAFGAGHGQVFGGPGKVRLDATWGPLRVSPP